MFAELDFDTLDDPATVLASLMKMKGRVLSLDDDLTHDQLMEVVAWISDKSNWSNHSVEGDRSWFHIRCPNHESVGQFHFPALSETDHHQHEYCKL